MDSIEEYFQGEYIVEKNRIKEIEELMKDVLKTICLRDSNGWPYELDDSKTQKENLPKKYSYSTSIMLLFVVNKFVNNIDDKSPVIPCINWEYGADLKEELEKRITNNDCVDDIKNLVSNSLEFETSNSLIVNSGTFGINDPLTLSWLAEIIANFNQKFDDVYKLKFTRLALERIKLAFGNPDGDESTLNLDSANGRRSTNHIFPLLRVIHLYKTLFKHKCFLIESDEFKLDVEAIKKSVHTKLFENLQNRINQQISYSVLKNSLFDTAELVLSIEGLILIDDKRRVDEKLLTTSFEILQINQKNNLYWRPLKPFVTSPQGDILLPLSIEIANSLLRICKHLESKKKYYFHEFFDIFENYSKWLLSNVSQCDLKGEDSKVEVHRGWRSEHVQKLNVIHPWETSQVVIYLMNYKSMLQDRIAYRSLKKSGLSCDYSYVKDNGKVCVDKWNDKWNVTISTEPNNCYKEIADEYISKHNKKSKFSMLLYGPPGTGKTAIAEDLAKALNWRLITITPSDFIKNGEADIEGRAKSIFKTLEQQKDCVILFDEIDRLILDRDSVYYAAQGDMFQFMTPSMLVKIKDLRTKKRSIFIIATNYEERIDSAIKRVGRIDQKFLINLPDLNQRTKIIKDFLRENIKESLYLSSADIETIDALEKSHKDTINEKSDKSEIKEENISYGLKRNNILDTAIENKLINTVTGVNILLHLSKETVFYTYGELSTLIISALKGIQTLDGLSENLIKTFKEQDQPTVKLSNYNRRFQTERKLVGGIEEEKDLQIYPYKEFFSLLYLKIESKIDLSESALTLVDLENVISKNEKELTIRVFQIDPDLELAKNTESDRVFKVLSPFEAYKANEYKKKKNA
jgi:SpoVK/Ycf46/Vps4 family AAA+-type ATPase